MILILRQCPNCNSELERVKDQLFCRNSNCSATASKRILHFIKVMKIKGLGEKTLDKLKLESINDIYELTIDNLITIMGDKIGSKLYTEISNSRVIELSIFIASFGIPLIGNSASTKLATAIESLWDIDTEICKKAGLGDKATSNLVAWIAENKEAYCNLPITTTVSNIETPENILYNVVITGKLNDFASRAKAKQFLESKGIVVLSSLSSKISFLICDTGSKTSSSYKKAIQMNIPIITMNDLLNPSNIIDGRN